MGSVENTTSLAVRSKDDVVKFGKELREKEFLFDKSYLNLNHGKKVPFLNLALTQDALPHEPTSVNHYGSQAADKAGWKAPCTEDPRRHSIRLYKTLPA